MAGGLRSAARLLQVGPPGGFVFTDRRPKAGPAGFVEFGPSGLGEEAFRRACGRAFGIREACRGVLGGQGAAC